MTYNVVILKSARYEYESIVGYLAQILKNASENMKIRYHRGDNFCR